MQRATVWILAVALVGLALGPAVSMAATEQEKRDAIDAGLAYLASIQQGDGRWEYGPDPEDTAATASAVLAFAEDPGTSYNSNIQAGLDYLLGKAQIVSIGTQTYGDPDGGGLSGKGVKFVLGGTNGRDTYVSGLVVPAIVAGAQKLGIVNSLVGGTGQMATSTYKNVVQDAIDYFAFGQNESGTARGGWRYYANSGDSDNSTAQWPVVSMVYAERLGIHAPQFVKDELDVWVNYIQNSTSGGSGYNNPTTYVNVSKTGALLLQMDYLKEYGGSAYAGYDLNYAGTDATQLGQQARLQKGMDFIDTRWQNPAAYSSSIWYGGNFGNPYAMWGAYKGLQVTIGLDDMTEISNLHADPGDIDNASHGWNWFEDYNEWLVNNQDASGYWPGWQYWTNPLSTAWAINMLRGDPVQPLDPIPAPSTLVGLASMGAMGLVLAWRRRRRRR